MNGTQVPGRHVTTDPVERGQKQAQPGLGVEHVALVRVSVGVAKSAITTERVPDHTRQLGSPAVKPEFTGQPQVDPVAGGQPVVFSCAG